jgi:hypothetical protein
LKIGLEIEGLDAPVPDGTDNVDDAENMNNTSNVDNSDAEDNTYSNKNTDIGSEVDISYLRDRILEIGSEIGGLGTCVLDNIDSMDSANT